LIQFLCDLGIRQLGEKRGFYKLALDRRQHVQGMAQEVALLADLQCLVWTIASTRLRWSVRLIVDAFLSTFEPQPVNRPAVRLIHDPSDDGSAGRIVCR
jgi:hypothetical protein